MSDTLIKGSVGLGGMNQRPDVQVVQKLLNAIPPAKGGSMPLLGVDGLSGPATCGAIRRFQAANIGSADGRIDPGRKTEQALLAVLNSRGVPANPLLGEQGMPASKSPKPPPSRGPQSPIRQRVLGICQSLLPPRGTLTQGQKRAGASGTGCGELPGRVFARVPVIPPGQKGAFKLMVPGAGNCYLTSPMTAWEQFAKAVDREFSVRTWVPFAGIRPLPGDIYVLGKFENSAAFQHVGIIVSAQGNEWITADGGQGNGWQSGFVERQFHSNGQIDGEFGNKAMLRGWVNLDALLDVATAAFPADL